MRILLFVLTVIIILFGACIDPTIQDTGWTPVKTDNSYSEPAPWVMYVSYELFDGISELCVVIEVDRDSEYVYFVSEDEDLYCVRDAIEILEQ